MKQRRSLTPSSRPRQSPHLFIFFGLIVLAVSCFFIFGEFWLRIWFGRTWGATKTALVAKTMTVAQLDTLPASELVEQRVRSYVSGFVPHPYVGFVYDPTKNSNVNEYGWYGPSPLTKKQVDTVIIALTGGSVAEGIFQDNGDQLRSLLESSGIFPGKKIVLVNFSAAGYKQPQQLFALEYMLAQGAEYDLVINIDGFNDVSLPGGDNYWQGIAPIYPRSWKWYAQTLFNPKTFVPIVILYSLQDMRIQHARLVSHFFSNSLVSLVLWDVFDRAADMISAHVTFRLQTATADYTTTKQTYTLSGPNTVLYTEQTVVDYAVEVWKLSSLQMAEITQTNGIAYLHILQPSAYDPTVKALTAQEKRDAGVVNQGSSERTLGFTFQQAVLSGYPQMRTIGETLLRQHEHFVDGTGVFRDESDAMFTDACHFTVSGSDIFTRFIASSVTDMMTP